MLVMAEDPIFHFFSNVGADHDLPDDTVDRPDQSVRSDIRWA